MNKKPAVTDRALNFIIAGLVAVIILCCCPAAALMALGGGDLLTGVRQMASATQAAPTPRSAYSLGSDELWASDPAYFQAASGRLQMVEFFAFW